MPGYIDTIGKLEAEVKLLTMERDDALRRLGQSLSDHLNTRQQLDRLKVSDKRLLDEIPGVKERHETY